MNFENFEIEIRDGVVFAVKNNPNMHYGISLGMCEDLSRLIDEFQSDESARALVISAGGPGFHRGAVMVQEMRPTLADLTEADFRDLVHKGQDLGRKVATCPKPVIGIALTGALGGGLEQLLRCDFVYTLDDARFTWPEVTLGFVAAWGGTQFGGRMLPMRKAQEMLLLGDSISGAEASAQGLVTQSFPGKEALEAHLDNVLDRLKFCSPTSYAQTKRCLAAVWAGPLSYGEQVEVDAEAVTMMTGDFLKAYAAWHDGKVYNYVTGIAEERT